MGLNDTPSGERLHIGLFGKRNAGKSSIMNAITGQDMSIVSDTPGTTTDPVLKAMEILPLGPVMLIDTPGLDDIGNLGNERVNKAKDALRKCHLVLVVIDGNEIANRDPCEYEKLLLNDLNKASTPYIICINKCDLNEEQVAIEKHISTLTDATLDDVIYVSAKNGTGINELKELIAKKALNSGESNLLNEKRLIGDLVSNGDMAILVVPIDESAPKGRLILPQQQTIRDLLESGAIPVVCKDTELEETLGKLAVKPKVVITDSQAFGVVSKIVPKDIYLTSFSILMSRYKGDFSWQYEGVKALDEIENGAKILISEGCTHHRQCGDIGTVKLPAWIRKYTGKDFEFCFTSGGEFPKDLSQYKLIIHCGGCTLNDKEMKYRINLAKDAGVPITNYGMCISYMNGILERSIEIFNI